MSQERPCDAAGVIPEGARQDELHWLAQRPVQATAGAHTSGPAR